MLRTSKLQINVLIHFRQQPLNMSHRMPRTHVARRKSWRQSFTMQNKSQTAMICSSLSATAEKETIPRLCSTRRSSKLILALWLQMKLICKIRVLLKRHCWTRSSNSIALISSRLSWLTTLMSYQVTFLVSHQSLLSILMLLKPMSRSNTESFSYKFWLLMKITKIHSRTLANSKIELDELAGSP